MVTLIQGSLNNHNNNGNKNVHVKTKTIVFLSGQDSVQSCGANQKSKLGGVTGHIENEIIGCSPEFLPNLITAMYAI